MASGAGDILKALRDCGPMSRADLSRMTGISSAGVTKITAQLKQDGVLKEHEDISGSSVGRPPVAIDTIKGARKVLAVHLAAGRVQVAVSDLSLQLERLEGFDYELGGSVDNLIDRVAVLARKVLARVNADPEQLVGVGIGVPGSVDVTRRVNTHSVLAGWQNVAFADAFEARLGLPVVLEHNATAIAMVEARQGGDTRVNSLLYLLLGKGIGGGFVDTTGRSRRSAVELGHIVVEPGGAPCRCGGFGCLEKFFSETPLKKMIGNPDVPQDQLIEAAMQSPGWPVVYEYFLQALGTTVTLLGPQKVVLGGSLNDAPESFLEALRKDLPQRVMPQQRLSLRIERTSLDASVGVLGAANAAFEEFFYSGERTPFNNSRRLHEAAR